MMRWELYSLGPALVAIALAVWWVSTRGKP
jgi:hypothetical protein